MFPMILDNTDRINSDIRLAQFMGQVYGIRNRPKHLVPMLKESSANSNPAIVAFSV